MMGYNGGFGLWTGDVLGMKNMDCALIYTFIINLWLALTGKWSILSFSFKNVYNAFLLFLGCSVLFSFVYYGLTAYQILQGGRKFLLILSLPILIKATPKEVEFVLKLLMYVCLITSILYILQIVVGRPLMPYALSWSYDSTVGLPRLYNEPANLHFFLTLSFLYPQFFPKRFNINIVRFVLFSALLCTLGRTNIIVGVVTVLLVLLLNGNVKKVTKTLIILSILLVPFVNIISERFEEGNTSNDIHAIMRKDFGADYTTTGENATMLYRFAWCYERGDYLLGRPIAEQIFGMGLCSDSQDWVNKRYKFKIGLKNEATGLPMQLGTPDISYGNMITYLGFGGMLVYILLCTSIVKYFWKYRRNNLWFLLCAALAIMMFLISFAGSVMSDTNSFCLMFLIMSLAYHNGRGIYKFEHNQ